MKFTELFLVSKPLIGVLHLPPLPGHVGHPGMDTVISKALKDSATLESAHFDGLLIENDGDNPPHFGPNKQIEESFATVMKVLRKNTRLPLGMEILYDMPGTVKLAAEVDADFVRLDVFVDDVQTSRGPIVFAQAAFLNQLRDELKPSMLLLADIQVKHATLLDQTKSIIRSAEEAVESGADAVIVTGAWTGEEPDLTDIFAIQPAVGDTPLLVGSGFSVSNAKKFLPYINGAIVASSIKTGEYIDCVKAKALRSSVNSQY